MLIPRKLALAAALAIALAPTAHADTDTLEPLDYDGVVSFWNPTITMDVLNGSHCPCYKIRYPATDMPWDNDAATKAIQHAVDTGQLHAGMTLMGFSLGVQNISQYMAHNQLPSGVDVLLLGDTEARNKILVSQGNGIPIDTPTKVTAVVNEYDGWSDSPDVTSAPGYAAALENAAFGTQKLHNYTHADLNNPANSTYTKGNITYITIPTLNMPNSNPNSRAEIDGAYSRPIPSTAIPAGTLASPAQAEQVDGGAPVPQHNEPVVP